jgi:hypothetical protein
MLNCLYSFPLFVYRYPYVHFIVFFFCIFTSWYTYSLPGMRYPKNNRIKDFAANLPIRESWSSPKIYFFLFFYAGKGHITFYFSKRCEDWAEKINKYGLILSLAENSKQAFLSPTHSCHTTVFFVATLFDIPCFCVAPDIYAWDPNNGH